MVDSAASGSQLTVRLNAQIADRIFRMEVQGEQIAKMATPGQFVHVKCGAGIDPLLRRPISICDINQEEQVLTMIYRAEGHGTRVLSEYVAGQPVDILGPLGQGFPTEGRQKGDHALLVGGGIGVPPLYYLGKQLKSIGVDVTYVNGFGTAGQVFLQEELSEIGTVHVVTVDGSRGVKGFVTDVLKEEYRLGENDWDVLYACGPLPMLAAIQQRYQSNGKEGYISLEQRMGCGIGACLACVCPVQDMAGGKNYRKICSDGPVFPFGEVKLS